MSIGTRGNQFSIIYATEGVKAACDWAYNGVREGSVLGDDYFLSRLPIVNLRLAEGGVRLAVTLNRIFHDKIPDSAPMLWENSGLADAM
ncbi:hypothetical protein F0562_032733 [Nyssa sinensis]|uniref:Aspergillus nuclease S1 n=1 Tax=Nyssa sinensis TaxID=561372 RepID=A0A5J5AQ30_9ASTE|nr:hypothetical protein F0562_032733 [Nyssa sinensis]